MDYLFTIDEEEPMHTFDDFHSYWYNSDNETSANCGT